MSKLGFYGDVEGMQLIQGTENCEKIRQITEDRIAADPNVELGAKWLQSLGHVLFHAYAQFFDETGI